MSNGVTYHFAVTAYSYLADNEGSPFKTLESGEARVSVDILQILVLPFITKMDQM